jgi:hypothetical protein
VPLGIALHGACFPHRREREDLRGFVGFVVTPYLRQLVQAWRHGYLTAADPAAREFDGPGSYINAATNFRSPIVRAYRQGFRCRRDELLGQRWLRSQAPPIDALKQVHVR